MQLLLPLQLFDNNGSPVVASDNIEFYDTGTTTPRSVFSEAALSTNLGTTMDTNAGGRFEFNPVFVASGSAVKVVFKDSAGATLETLDPCPATAVVASAATDISFDAAKTAFDTKFWGSIAVAKEAAKQIRPGGTITLTSGFLARRTVPGTYIKTAMNAAIEATAKILAKELAPIRVNVVSPGLTDTEAYSGMDDTSRQAMLERAAGSLPAGKAGSPEDLAQGYLFAIDNPYVTGAVIDIDGGALIN